MAGFAGALLYVSLTPYGVPHILTDPPSSSLSFAAFAYVGVESVAACALEARLPREQGAVLYPDELLNLQPSGCHSLS